MRLSLGATSIIIFTVFDSRHRRVPLRGGCMHTCRRLPLLGPEKTQRAELAHHVRVSTQTAHVPFCLCLKLVTETPPTSPNPPYTYTQPPQSRDCCHPLSNYMERGAEEPKPFPSVVHSVTHGQAPALIKPNSDAGTSLPLFICILWTACTPLMPTAHGRRAVTRHSCLSSV